jgi:uncharacterized protein (TIGR00730 family)
MTGPCLTDRVRQPCDHIGAFLGAITCRGRNFLKDSAVRAGGAAAGAAGPHCDADAVHLTPQPPRCHMREMSPIRRICVYCGSNPGRDARFLAAARRLGEILAENRVGLVFGGGSTGLMGAIAHSARARGGEIVGVIPKFLEGPERLFRHADEVIITADMHERKMVMFERADAFVALPGGIGTLEELIEQLTWVQLGVHRKPILIANIAGFWDPLIAMFDHLRDGGFLPNDRGIDYLVTQDVEDVLPKLQAIAARIGEDETQGMTERVERM